MQITTNIIRSYKATKLQSNKIVLGLLAVVGMIGTFTNASEESDAQNASPATATIAGQEDLQAKKSVSSEISAELKIIIEFFSQLYILLDIPNQLDKHVSIPKKPDSNLNSPEYLQYANFLGICKNDLSDDYAEKVDKNTRSKCRGTNQYYMNEQDMVIDAVLEALPQLRQQLSPKIIKRLCLSEMFKLLDPVAARKPKSDINLVSLTENPQLLNTMVQNLHKDDGLYGITLRALEGMKEKGIIPADSVDRMIEQLKSLVG